MTQQCPFVHHSLPTAPGDRKWKTQSNHEPDAPRTGWNCLRVFLRRQLFSSGRVFRQFKDGVFGGRHLLASEHQSCQLRLYKFVALNIMHYHEPFCHRFFSFEQRLYL